MAIVVEDGTGVAGASSYLTAVEMRAFALARGVALSSDDAVVGVLLVKASDYIDAREAEFVGSRNDEDQALSWPRTYRGEDLGVPQKIKDAQAFLALAVNAGTDLLPVTGSAVVKSKKAGPLEIAYAVPDSGMPPPSSWPSVPAAEKALAFYFKSGSSAQTLSVY